MSLVQFFRLIARHLKWMVLTGLFLGFMIFWSSRNEKQFYSTDTLINTGLISGYNIESQDGGSTDYAYTTNELENLQSIAKAYETFEQLAAELLTTYLMLDKPDPQWIIPETFEALQISFPQEMRDSIVNKQSFDSTLANVIHWRESFGNNPIKDVLLSDDALFGIKHLKSAYVVRRQGNSDMLRMSYSTTDPGVCLQTIKMHTRIFIARHRELKEGQSTSVLTFFGNATDESANELRSKEDAMLAFMVKNKIINYYEQTRYIAAKKEDLDEMYFEELMDMVAADSTLRSIELQIGDRVNLPEINRTLVRQKDELTDVSARIARMEVWDVDSGGTDQAELFRLRNEADRIKENIQKTAAAHFAVSRTPEGIEIEQLLSAWLEHVIGVEQAVARLNVLRQRKTEFESIYNKFAPWGSRIKRIEREINVAEQAYLENLHSFNQAKLHNHSMLMATNLKVVDPPFYPTEPSASKRGMMTIVGFIAGMFIVLALVVVLEYIDNTLKDPVNASEVVGIELFGALPRFKKDWEKNGSIDFAFIRNRAVELLLQRIKLDLRSLHKSEKPNRITVLSTREVEGKSFITDLAVNKLRSFGERVLYLRPASVGNGGSNNQTASHKDDREYFIDHSFFEKQDEAELMGDPDLDVSQYSYLFLEIPGLLTCQYPADLIAHSDVSLMVCRANRVWNQADEKALETFDRAVDKPCRLVLNGTRVDLLETSIGEIPKRRSFFRKVIKRIASLNLSGKTFSRG